MDRETGWCMDAVSPLASPSLDIYSPHHHTYSMCISTVHYCCHRNVMHSVSYRLTQLNGVPCLICSGSFILILYWKGIVNTIWRRDERRMGRRGWKNKIEKGGWILPSALFSASLPILPFFLSLFSLMSVLSIGNWISGYCIHTYSTVTLYYIHVAISSHSVTLCVLISLIGSGGGRWCFQKALKWLVFTMWWQRKVVFDMI